jgi:hypothetical protein
MKRYSTVERDLQVGRLERVKFRMRPVRSQYTTQRCECFDHDLNCHSYTYNRSDSASMKLTRRSRPYALDLLDLLSFNKAHDSPNSRDYTRKPNKETSRPRGSIKPIHSPHKTAKYSLQKSVPHITPHEEVDLPKRSRRCANTRERLRWGFAELPRKSWV